MSRSTVFFGIAVAVALGGCGRGRMSQQTDATATTTADEAMTVVGCLVPSGETPESRAVGTSGHPPPPTFMLVNVVAPVRGSAARSYDLVADEDRLNDLQRFANSRVEVSGFIVAMASNVRRIHVKDVRRLEPTCGVSKRD